MQDPFQNNYILNFTQKLISIILFRGILIDTRNIDRFTTSTYKKKTS